VVTDDLSAELREAVVCACGLASGLRDPSDRRGMMVAHAPRKDAVMDPISGAIGGLVVLVAQRVIDVPRDVKRNDQRIRERDEDLMTWVTDDEKALRIELRRNDDTAARGQYNRNRSTSRAMSTARTPGE
jgi:hypothetical protein